MALLDLGQLELGGRDVVLRPLVAEDAAALALAAAESRATYVYSTAPEGRQGAEAYIARALKQKSEGQRYPFALHWRGRIVGSTSYSEFQPWVWPEGSAQQRHDRPDAVEIGYTWLAASAQRTACNTEAKLLLLEQAFERWAVHSVYLRTDERNQRSRAAIMRIGARFEGIRRAHCPGADGAVRSSAFFSIVLAEWPEVRERLRGFLAAR